HGWLPLVVLVQHDELVHGHLLVAIDDDDELKLELPRHTRGSLRRKGAASVPGPIITSRHGGPNHSAPVFGQMPTLTGYMVWLRWLRRALTSPNLGPKLQVAASIARLEIEMDVVEVGVWRAPLLDALPGW